VVSVTPRPRFSPGERTPGTHCTGAWVVPRTGLDTEVRGTVLSPLPGIEPRSPGHRACSQTLYWLDYPVHNFLLLVTYFSVNISVTSLIGGNKRLIVFGIIIMWSQVSSVYFWGLVVTSYGVSMVSRFVLSCFLIQEVPCRLCSSSESSSMQVERFTVFTLIISVLSFMELEQETLGRTSYRERCIWQWSAMWAQCYLLFLAIVDMLKERLAHRFSSHHRYWLVIASKLCTVPTLGDLAPQVSWDWAFYVYWISIPRASISDNLQHLLSRGHFSRSFACNCDRHLCNMARICYAANDGHFMVNIGFFVVVWRKVNVSHFPRQGEL
jgi:hypothetical protein